MLPKKGGEGWLAFSCWESVPPGAKGRMLPALNGTEEAVPFRSKSQETYRQERC